MSEQDADARPDPGTLTYDKAVAELESIIERIERGEVGLEESLSEYRRGALLLRRCRSILDVAEQEVEQLAAMEGEAASRSGDPEQGDARVS